LTLLFDWSLHVRPNQPVHPVVERDSPYIRWWQMGKFQELDSVASISHIIVESIALIREMIDVMVDRSIVDPPTKNGCREEDTNTKIQIFFNNSKKVFSRANAAGKRAQACSPAGAMKRFLRSPFLGGNHRLFFLPTHTDGICGNHHSSSHPPGPFGCLRWRIASSSTSTTCACKDTHIIILHSHCLAVRVDSCLWTIQSVSSQSYSFFLAIRAPHLDF